LGDWVADLRWELSSGRWANALLAPALPPGSPLVLARPWHAGVSCVTLRLDGERVAHGVVGVSGFESVASSLAGPGWMMWLMAAAVCRVR